MSEMDLLTGSYVILSKLTFEDSQFCVRLRNSNQGKFLNSGSKSVEEQNIWLEQRPNNEFNYLISDNTGGKMGIISLIGIDHRNKRAEPARFIMLPNVSRRNVKLVFEPLYLIYKLSFEYLELNRLQGTIAKSNEKMIKLQQYLGMEIEGVMRQHSFINNKFEDVVAISLLKDRYLAHTKKLLRSLLT